MKQVLLFLSLLVSFYGFGQKVGIGTTNPQQKLHVAGKVQIDSLSAGSTGGIVTTNAFGLLNSLPWNGSVETVLRGNGTFGALTNVWSTTSNSGINPASQFLGTTDQKPLILKIENQYAGGLDTTYNIFLGKAAGVIHKGKHNIAFGNKAFTSNQTGNANVAIGRSALASSTI